MGTALKTKVRYGKRGVPGLSGKLWPAHVKPRHDELLSSWLVRLAMAHSQKLHTFCALAWSRRQQIWNRDIDKCADLAILNLLVERTGTPSDRVARTTLAAYAGYVYERHNPNGNTRWLMPVGIYHRTRRIYGLQFCPRCLAGDAVPYYRRSWRLAFVTFCEVHRVPLSDRCPQCGAPINFHRNEMGDRRKWVPESITLCHVCRYDLGKTPAKKVDQPAGRRILEFQRSLTRIMRRGWAEVSGYGPIYSHLYFTVLHQLMKVCAMEKRAARLREAIASELGLKPSPPTLTKECRDIERLSTDERQALIDMARHLLSRWPHTLIRLCQSNKVWSAVLLRDLDPAPFWYWSVVHDHLYRISYTPSDQEIYSAVSHLKSRGVALNKRQISRCLGINNDVFRKRSTKFSLP